MDNSRHSAVVKELQARLRQMQRAGTPAPRVNLLASTGVEPLDALLTPHLFRPGMIVEWVVAGAGSGAARLAVPMVIHALQTGGAFVVIDDRREFYPPAAVRLGLDLERTIVVRPHNRQETVWTLEQALRCAGVAATLAWIGKLPDRCFRRLQLAAEHGAGLGVFLRPVEVLRAPSWADLRWFVRALPMRVENGERGEGANPMRGSFITAAPRSVCSDLSHSSGRRVRVELIHCREGTPGGTVDLEIDDETGAVRVVPPLAPAASVSRPARA
jgi:protein ImuA